MRVNEVPSAEMLHSVGALMDTSFLRAAVADANETSRARPASAVPGRWRRLRWVQTALARLGKSDR